MGCKQETKEETMERNVNLPEYLRQLRKSRHYKQEDIALQLQISWQTYSHYETGRIRPSIHVLYKLAKFYGVSADEILEHMEELPFKQEEMEEEQQTAVLMQEEKDRMEQKKGWERDRIEEESQISEQEFWDCLHRLNRKNRAETLSIMWEIMQAKINKQESGYTGGKIAGFFIGDQLDRKH